MGSLIFIGLIALVILFIRFILNRPFMDKIGGIKKYRLMKGYVLVLFICTAIFIYQAPKAVENQDQAGSYQISEESLDMLTEKELQAFEVETRKI